MKVAALASNARFVPLDDAFGNLMVRVPVQGLAAIDAFVADLQSPEDPPAISIAPGRLQDGLSERELEVLRRLAQGKSNPQIAEALFITRNTVQNHVSSILIKTNLTNRAQAAVYAKEHGIV